jgi:hypothetical protein
MKDLAPKLQRRLDELCGADAVATTEKAPVPAPAGLPNGRRAAGSFFKRRSQ